MGKSPKTQGAGAVKLGDRYLRAECIGGGGLGRVWRGTQVSTGREIAIKAYEGLEPLTRGGNRQTVLHRLDEAIRLQAKIESPFVIRVVDQDMGHQPPYVVFELAAGGNLRQLLADGPLKPEVAISFFLQVAHGLSAAHAKGVVHRDLKPENIVFDRQGNAKITDFGLTGVADRDGSLLRRAYVGYGSLGYMAPELFRRNSAPTPGTDIYALGILLYEMLVGHIPGRRSPLPSKVIKGLPAELDDLFDGMAQDDLSKRIESIDEVLGAAAKCKDLQSLLSGSYARLNIESPIPLPGLPREFESPSADSSEEAGDEEDAPSAPATLPGELNQASVVAETDRNGTDDISFGEEPTLDGGRLKPIRELVKPKPATPIPRARKVPSSGRPKSRASRRSKTKDENGDQSDHGSEPNAVIIDSVDEPPTETDMPPEGHAMPLGRATEPSLDRTTGSTVAAEQAAQSASQGSGAARPMVVTESTAKGPSVVLDDQIFEVDTKGSDNDEDGDSDPRIRTVVHRAKTIEADIQPVRATRVKPLEDNESD